MKKDLCTCIYLKDLEYLLTLDDFKAIYDDKKVTLMNFKPIYPKKDRIHIGVCDDLPRYWATIFNKKYKDKYTFKVVKGNDNDYFAKGTGWEHYFLLAWPKIDDKRIYMELKNNSTIFPERCIILDPSSQVMGSPNIDLYGFTLIGLTNILPDEMVLYKIGLTSIGTMKYFSSISPYPEAILCIRLIHLTNRI
ncbi:MAG: hypothetical protein HQK76_03545 [Desulfobacterales bacterium]|nr:hypothetical protein [Desulfobacterales bacterium]